MMKRILFPVLLAFLFWLLMFFPYVSIGLSTVDFSLFTSHYSLSGFWLLMTAASLTLTALAIALGGWPRLSFDWREVALGIGIAAVLWGVFWVGDKCSQMLFDFARPQVDQIYGIKDGSSPSIVALLLLLIIGPGEEIFWRGFIQQHISGLLAGRFGDTKKAQTRANNLALVCATAAYTLIHVSSLNFMLVMAALVCGLAWGALYRVMPNHFAAIVLSHALWDAAAFVWFPL